MSRENVKLLILKSGEHVIGVATTGMLGENIGLEYPVNIMPNPQGSNIVFVPYLQFSVESKCTFSLQSDVRHVLTPTPELAEHYYTQFVSPIQIAQ